MKKHVLLTLLPCALIAADWQQWRGPNRNNISSETDWTDQWPSGKPKELWRTDVQLGFGSIVVGDGRLFTLGHDGDSTATLFCIDADSGKSLWKKTWKSDLGDKYFEGGPVSTPIIEENRLYLLTRWGKCNASRRPTANRSGSAT